MLIIMCFMGISNLIVLTSHMYVYVTDGTKTEPLYLLSQLAGSF